MIKTPVNGMRDISLTEMEIRLYLLNKIREVYTRFGFSEIQTPAVEHIENLLSKQGWDNEKLIFKILKRGEKLEKAYELFGSHLVKDENGNTLGTIFRVYAPNAKIVSVIGDFNFWDSRTHTMKKIDDQGIFELYIDGIKEWEK